MLFVKRNFFSMFWILIFVASFSCMEAFASPPTGWLAELEENQMPTTLSVLEEFMIEQALKKETSFEKNLTEHNHRTLIKANKNFFKALNFKDIKFDSSLNHFFSFDLLTINKIMKVFLDSENKRIFFFFRGTAAQDINEWRVNLDGLPEGPDALIQQINNNLSKIQNNPFTDLTSSTELAFTSHLIDAMDKIPKKALFHKGYLKLMSHLILPIYYICHQRLVETAARSDWKIYLIGHSRGGALAMLAAGLIGQLLMQNEKKEIFCFTTSSARSLLNEEAASWYQRVVESGSTINTLHINSHLDIVPNLHFAKIKNYSKPYLPLFLPPLSWKAALILFDPLLKYFQLEHKIYLEYVKNPGMTIILDLNLDQLKQLMKNVLEENVHSRDESESDESEYVSIPENLQAIIPKESNGSKSLLSKRLLEPLQSLLSYHALPVKWFIATIKHDIQELKEKIQKELNS